MNTFKISTLPIDFDFETKKIFKKLSDAKSALAELKGFVNIIPNQSILINSLVLQEAKDSSEVENIITTHDELFKSELQLNLVKNIANKEVQNYKTALLKGVQQIKKNNIISNKTILDIQKELEKNDARYRKLPGTKLKNDQTGDIVYTPPQNYNEIVELMDNLVKFINQNELQNIDSLIKIAIIHFQFESIHPFYDGNGRTGRILNILYLVQQGLLENPILYLSRFIVQNKGNYYKYLQNVRDNNDWETWVLFTLEGIEITAKDTIKVLKEIKDAMQEYKNFLRDNFPFYSQDLINNIFTHPYTKIDFLKKDLNVSRQTASKYLNKLADHKGNYIEKVKVGKFDYFVNVKLFNILSRKRNVMLRK